ncbi:hypothetical protein F66182_3269 [Fusarium sp. NRRL 66182]|nr:hypothetical protein F66182_3269 [Fusarium sp. NRRL 66182]
MAADLAALVRDPALDDDMASFPPSPVTTIDWNMKSPVVNEVNGHIEATFTKSTGKWSALKFITDPFIRVHGLAPGLNYGQQALEGLKAFRTPNNESIILFRPDLNARRFQHSAEVLSMPPVPEDVFIKACRAAVALNAAYVPPHESGGGLYIRPLIFGSSAHYALTPPDEFKFCVYVIPTGVNDGTKLAKVLVLDDFDRSAPRGSGHAKVGGNYAPVLRWSMKARSEGFDLTLHMDSARHREIDEFSTCAFLGVRHEHNGEPTTLVVPDSPCIINSVTSDTVQNLARSYGWTIDKRPVRYTELASFDEVLAAGTSVSLVPVMSITRQRQRWFEDLPDGDRVRIESGENLDKETVTYLDEGDTNGGDVYQKLFGHLRGLQRGTLDDEFGWRAEVRAEDCSI